MGWGAERKAAGGAAGGSFDIAFAAGSDWHIYRFSVTDNKAKLWIDGELKGEFTLPENKSDGLLSFSGKSADGSALSYDVNYVKLKTTDESWQRPEARMTEVTSWTYEENFDGDTIPAGWAKENAVSSGLKDAPIRWIVDDCVKFVEREIRRGNHYDAIIMDPPSYGRGPKGEIWKIEEAIHPLIKLCAKLLSDDPLFFLVNS